MDDLFLLAAFFGDPQLRAREVVAGQFLGIGALVTVSAGAALTALVVPPGFPALLGVVPLALGAKGLWALRRHEPRDDPDSASIRKSEREAARWTRSPMMAIAAVTVANGGDNLGVYIPLFARDPASIPLYAVVFAALTALWCFVGHRLVRNEILGHPIRRYGHVILPVVMIALGLWILSGARALIG